ncbi:cytochrome P450 [Sorangium sp. So ce861]|uniref:cytochrome P450 n=1 Tax=Sorangium sp. So ce861 TaxID=3133323 RepID=UPI003F5DF4EF
MAGQLSPEEMRKLEAALDVGVEVVSEIVEERRRRPLDNDILTPLIQAEEQGDRLRKDELAALVAAVLVGGTETTVHLICFAMHEPMRELPLGAAPTIASGRRWLASRGGSPSRRSSAASPRWSLWGRRCSRRTPRSGR